MLKSSEEFKQWLEEIKLEFKENGPFVKKIKHEWIQETEDIEQIFKKCKPIREMLSPTRKNALRDNITTAMGTSPSSVIILHLLSVFHSAVMPTITLTEICFGIGRTQGGKSAIIAHYCEQTIWDGKDNRSCHCSCGRNNGESVVARNENRVGILDVPSERNARDPSSGDRRNGRGGDGIESFIRDKGSSVGITTNFAKPWKGSLSRFRHHFDISYTEEIDSILTAQIKPLSHHGIRYRSNPNRSSQHASLAGFACQAHCVAPCEAIFFNKTYEESIQGTVNADIGGAGGDTDIGDAEGSEGGSEGIELEDISSFGVPRGSGEGAVGNTDAGGRSSRSFSRSARLTTGHGGSGSEERISIHFQSF
ncbi:hypothetical protein GH714_037462 [Hevea brasiliensis]|uniref:Uncharacterized protein n=1 Tax=Hevea brasiliensis TaxID=3981 RepID=A0A6A6L8G7_HEVBR|nr:hypothetical protein GH714_037462 [Hevea brasiliensis]